jgi:hypothetical protein
MRPEQQKQKVANEREKKLSVVMQVAAFTKKGTRKCKTCGMYVGHYSTTCPLNQNVAGRGRGGHRGRRGTMGTKKGDHQLTGNWSLSSW